MAAVLSRAAMTLAFKIWAEVIPVTFKEDLSSPLKDIDVIVEFGMRK